MSLVHLLNQGLSMSDLVSVPERYVHTLLLAACDIVKKLPDDETGHTL